MKFVVISDTHGKHRALNLPTGDVIIHSGDFCDDESDDNMNDFLKWYAHLDYKTKILPKEITYLSDSGTTINGINVWGSPVQPDLIGWAFARQRGPEMKLHWDLIPENTKILITHTPPFGILDKSRSGKSLGCEELTKKLKTLKVQFHILGHIHASYGEVKIGETKFINASNMD